MTIAQLAIEHQQYKRGHTRPNEGQQAGENTSDADDGEPPSRRYLATSSGNRRPQRQDAVGDRVKAPHEGQGQQGEARPNKGQDTEGDRGYAPQQQQPPIFREFA